MKPVHPGEKQANSRKELLEKSQHWIIGYATLGHAAFFTRWSKELTELRARTRGYRQKYRLKNLQRYRAYHREYEKRRRAKNPNLVRESNQRAYAKAAEIRREYARQYRVALKADAEKYAAHKIRHNEARKARAKTNPKYLIGRRIRSRINMAISKAYGVKAASTYALIGCGREEFMRHIESTWTTGMSWDNYGRKGWHIDHKIPINAFDITIAEEQFKCFHYTNTQALWALDNWTKGANQASR